MQLDNPYETETQEFKASLSELDKGILALTAMLNKGGKGKVYFGVADNGEILGVRGTFGKETIKKVSTRIAETVRPAIVPKIHIEVHDTETIIVVEAVGFNKPYSAAGEYRIRVGSENRKIDPVLLGELFFSNPTTLAENVEALNQDLSFTQLKGLYLNHGLTIDDATFAKNMGLLTKQGNYNYLAEILADNNNCSIKVVRFQGKDKLEMLSRNEYGYKCLLLAMKQAFDYVAALNEVRVNLHNGLERKEMPLFNLDCLDEAWTNACLHNRWTSNVPPVIYIFADRIEIVSTGGLPVDFSTEEFFAGVSRPRNLALQKIMGQLGMVEQTGHGVPQIVGIYGREAFELAENHITVTLPFAFEPTIHQVNDVGLPPSHAATLKLLKMHPLYTLDELAKELRMSKARVSQIVAELKAAGKLERIGGRKGGYWQVK